MQKALRWNFELWARTSNRFVTTTRNADERGCRAPVRLPHYDIHQKSGPVYTPGERVRT